RRGERSTHIIPGVFSLVRDSANPVTAERGVAASESARERSAKSRSITSSDSPSSASPAKALLAAFLSWLARHLRSASTRAAEDPSWT
ncbi:hypothetical protein RTBOTA2_002268, partial [Rhodotorula toruloides]